jgi:CheY-like chemotaxis protein
MLRFSSENLLSLINDVLDLHKIEAGKVELEEVDFQPAHLFHNIVQTMKLKAGEKRIGLRSEIDHRLPAVLKGDPVRLMQVLNNLVSNAVKFTNEGEVVVEITVADENSASALLCISVCDTGIGIPEDKQTSIFDAFEQAAQDTTRRYGGTGLGLTITKRLLELQGSQIMLESKPGEGSRFFFSLRLKKGILRTGIQAGRDAAHSTGDLGHLRLLLVEDNPMNVLLARKYLEKWNLTPDHATDGQIAVYMVQQNQYDLVLMDLQMPVMDGFEATRQIRGLGEAYRYLPVVALTADTVADVREKATAAGMTDFLTKPYNPADLYKILERYSRGESRQVLQPVGIQAAVLVTGNHKPPLRLQKIQELADGDEVFVRRMIRSCKEGLSDLHFRVEQAVREKDGLLLDSVIHKAKAMITLLDLVDLLQLLQQTRAMLADPQAEQALEENLTQVQECCRQAGYELSEMLAEE